MLAAKLIYLFLVCDDCYGLVGDEVDKLRILDQNITTFVNDLVNNDTNEEFGSFSVRLTKTIEDLRVFKEFVSLGNALKLLKTKINGQMLRLSAFNKQILQT